MLDASPEVLAHNLETVPRLQSTVRDHRANFASRCALEHAKPCGKVTYTKTSLMFGFGETEARSRKRWTTRTPTGVDIFTMGQYLQPTKRHLPVDGVRHAREFARLGALGDAKGFVQVVSSPLSRSSYHAEQAFV